MEVSIRELKAHLSRYLRQVQAGEEIVVTSHGKTVGRLMGAPPRPADRQADAIKRLNALPWVRAGDGEKIEVPPQRIASPPGKPLISELVLKDRE